MDPWCKILKSRDRSRDHMNWNFLLDMKHGIKYIMYTKFQVNTIRQTQVISICGSANQRRESKNKDGTTKVENMKIGQFVIDHIFWTDDPFETFDPSIEA